MKRRSPSFGNAALKFSNNPDQPPLRRRQVGTGAACSGRPCVIDMMPGTMSCVTMISARRPQAGPAAHAPFPARAGFMDRFQQPGAAPRLHLDGTPDDPPGRHRFAFCSALSGPRRPLRCNRAIHPSRSRSLKNERARRHGGGPGISDQGVVARTRDRSGISLPGSSKSVPPPQAATRPPGSSCGPPLSSRRRFG